MARGQSCELPREIVEKANGNREEQAAACAAINRTVEQSAAMRRYFEPWWSLNRGFYLGNQTLEVRGNRLVPSRQNRRRSTYSNQVLPRVRAVVAGLTANRPVMQAVASDEDDPNARQAAKFSDEVLSGIRYATRLDAAVRSAVLSAVIYGKGFLLAGWDPSRGDSMEVPVCPVCEASGPAIGTPCQTCVQGGVEVALVGRPMMTGDFFVRAYPPQMVLADDSAVRLSDAAWVRIEHQMSKTEARQRFGDKIPWSEETVDTTIDLVPGGGEITGAPKRRAVRIFEMLWSASPHLPRGARVLYHQDRILAIDQEVSGDGQLPLAEITVDEVPDRFWSKGLVDDLVPLNRAYNRTMQAVEKLVDLSSDPRLKAEEGVLVSQDDNLPDAGKVIYYKPEARRVPDFENPPAVSPVIMQHIELLTQQMDFYCQQYSPYRGQPSSSVTSGLQARLLIERSATSLASVSTSIEEAIARIGKVLIMAAQRYLPESRMLSYAGDHGRHKVVRFRSADLAGVQDVAVVAGSAFPESKEARRDFMLQLAARVAGPNGLTPELRAVLEAMETGVKLPPDPMRPVIDQANEENDALMRGEELLVHELQVHSTHVQEHAKFAATERFTKAPIEVQAALAAHIKEHELAAMREQAQRAEMEMAFQQLMQMSAGLSGPAVGQQAAPYPPGAPAAAGPEMADALQEGIPQ